MNNYGLRCDRVVATGFIGEYFFPITFINKMRQACLDILIDCHSMGYQFRPVTYYKKVSYISWMLRQLFMACFLRYYSYRKHYER